MTSVTDLQCVCCGATYPDGEVMTCPACPPGEGILDVRFDLDAARRGLTRGELARREPSIWRYRELLPVVKMPSANLDVGWTPMIEAPRLADHLGVRRVRLKDDGQSASGSFKDRASAIAVARAVDQNCPRIACASTGNAATSLARCAANAGIAASIFVGRDVPTGKLAQLLAFGAQVFQVKGSYADAYDLCMQSCAKYGWYNRNCAINPYLVEGKKTGGLEVAEQCADDPPTWVAVSVGDGCTIAGIGKGLRQMREIGVVDWSARLLGVQAEGVAPIARGFERAELDHSASGTTYADSINVAVPRNWRKAQQAVRASRGAIVTASDDEIRAAVRDAGRLAGVFAEPAAAAAVAGVGAAVRDGIINADDDVVIMITGNGLKDLDGALQAVGRPHLVEPQLSEVERIVASDQV